MAFSKAVEVEDIEVAKENSDQDVDTVETAIDKSEVTGLKFPHRSVQNLIVSDKKLHLFKHPPIFSQ